ncbi:MAG: AI-2E family transporter [Rhodopirellula sp.]|nr:AI-2E family transporter [Rhodopirellula sp.]
MSRIVSFAFLIVILLLIAGLFFWVMSNFFLPLFLAVLLVVIFQPLHQWCLARCNGRPHLSAAMTTAAIVLIVLLPLLGILSQAVSEGIALYRAANERDRSPAADTRIDSDKLAGALTDRRAVSESISHFGERFGIVLSPQDVEATIAEKLELWVGPVALSTARFTGNLVIGLLVMLVALYYFFVDGPWMIRNVMKLSPLDDRYEEQLIRQFSDITRAVVVATLLSAVAQGLLAGFGYFLVGVDMVFLLTVVTMLLAMVPFVGAGAVWVPVCLWLYFHDERHLAAVLLAVYGAAVISLVDNLIKPMVLHGRSNIHPLLALLSVLGGVQAMGPVGIFVGPMVVAFFHALLNMLHRELETMPASST